MPSPGTPTKSSHSPRHSANHSNPSAGVFQQSLANVGRAARKSPLRMLLAVGMLGPSVLPLWGIHKAFKAISRAVERAGGTRAFIRSVFAKERFMEFRDEVRNLLQDRREKGQLSSRDENNDGVIQRGSNSRTTSIERSNTTLRNNANALLGALQISVPDHEDSVGVLAKTLEGRSATDVLLKAGKFYDESDYNKFCAHVARLGQLLAEQLAGDGSDIGKSAAKNAAEFSRAGAQELRRDAGSVRPGAETRADTATAHIPPPMSLEPPRLSFP